MAAAEETFRVTCSRDCPDACFIAAGVEDGRLVSVRPDPEFEYTAGFLCPRGAGDIKRVYSERRVLYPHSNADKGRAPSFSRLTWKEAAGRVAGAIRGAIDKRGPEGVLYLDYAGNSALLASAYPYRLWNALDAAVTDHSLCSRSGHEALALHYGRSYGTPVLDIEKKRTIVFWGSNAAVSASHLFRRALMGRESAGATIAAIDPRRSETAEKADLWIAPRPGSDAALAYGIARAIIEKGLADNDFIAKYASGYDEYKDECMKWTPERVESVTGVAPEAVERLVEKIAAGIAIERDDGGTNAHAGTSGRTNGEGAAVFIIGIGMQKGEGGAEAVRAVSLLPALLGIHRGFYYTNSRGRSVDFDALTLPHLRKKPAKVVNMVSIGERLAAGEFGFVMVSGMNPAMTLPDQKAVRAGLARNDTFVVTFDTHFTETCGFSDIVLPAATFYEKCDIQIGDAHPFVRLSRRAIEPRGESVSEPELAGALAANLGVAGVWIEEEPLEACAKAFAGALAEGTVEELMAGKIVRLKEMAADEYQTPSKKIEFAVASPPAGIGRLPAQIELPAQDGKLTLLSSAVPKYLHSQFQDVYGPVPDAVWISPADALRIGISDGDRVAISSGGNEMTMTAAVTDRVPEGAAWCARPIADNEGASLNHLTSCAPQKLGGGPEFNSTRVTVKKA